MSTFAQAYDFLADWFEILNDDCDYSLWSQYFIDGLSRLHAGKTGMELGCGSGAFSRALAKAGYAMTGADVSAPMLSKAARLAREEGLSVSFLSLDAANPKTASKFDFILSPNDCYNYLPQKKLPAAFRKIAQCLVRGGIFWFDVSSAYKLREKVANNMFADDRDDVTYLAFNTLEEDRVKMDVTLFVREADGRFRRFDETHIQYIHEEEDILAALCLAGFEVLSAEGHLGAKKEGSDRLNFICRKK